MQTQTTNTPQTTATSITQDIRRMADEIRVKIHLAAMEAKDAWYKLEPKLHEFEQKAEAAKGRLVDGLDKIGEELKEQMGRLLERIRGNNGSNNDSN